jgi:hypothetical protein
MFQPNDYNYIKCNQRSSRTVALHTVHAHSHVPQALAQAEAALVPDVTHKLITRDKHQVLQATTNDKQVAANKCDVVLMKDS